MTLNYAIWAFVQPSHWILLGALLTIMFWRWRLGRVTGLATAALVVVLGLLPVGAWLMRPLETRFPAADITGDVTGIVVMAGSERLTISELHSTPHLNSMGTRLTTFLLLAERYSQARLVHTGGMRGGRIARDLILGTGVDAARVAFETDSRNTCDSARATQALAEPRPGERWLLVTSAFHMPRTVACFRAAGWDITPYPTDYRRGPSAWHFGLVDNLADVDLAAHEWVGLAYYRLRGYTKELFPAPQPL